MSRPRFLADHDLNEHIIDGVLRQEPTIEFIRSREVGLSDRPDPEILEYAATQGLIVVSHDAGPCVLAACCGPAHRWPVHGSADPCDRFGY